MDRDVLDAGPMRIAKRSCTVACRAEGRVVERTSVFGIVDDCAHSPRWSGDAVGMEDLATTSDSIDACLASSGTFFTIALEDPEAEFRFERPSLIRHPAGVGRLRSHLRRLYAPEARHAPALREMAASDVLEALVSVLRADVKRRMPSQTQNRRLKAVRLCQEFMMEHLERTVTLVDLAEISGLGVRSLFNAFEAVTGLSPMAYLRAQRLSCVHKILLNASNADVRIIDVAADWGFWHMGHFAGAYAAMFGETPSQTLTNARS